MLFSKASTIGIHEELKIYVHIELEREEISFPVFPLLDTGATGTMFPIELAEILGIDYASGKPRQVNGIAGHLKGRVHKVNAALIDDSGKEVGRHIIDVTFVEGSDLSIIGMNFISKFDWELLFSEQKMKVEGPQINREPSID